MRIELGVSSVFQILLWTLLFGSPFWVEVPARLLMLAGGVFALLFALGAMSSRRFAIAADLVNVFAISAYCLVPVVCGGEAVEGFLMMVFSGLIVLILGPPALNAALLSWMIVFKR